MCVVRIMCNVCTFVSSWQCVTFLRIHINLRDIKSWVLFLINRSVCACVITSITSLPKWTTAEKCGLFDKTNEGDFNVPDVCIELL